MCSGPGNGDRHPALVCVLHDMLPPSSLSKGGWRQKLALGDL